MGDDLNTECGYMWFKMHFRPNEKRNQNLMTLITNIICF